MTKYIGLLAGLLMMLAALAAPGRASAELPCKALKDIDLEHGSLTRVTVESIGDAKACRFLVTARPAAEPDVRIEVWVPIGAAWNGRYVQLDAGGFAGQITTARLQAVAARGYAVAAAGGSRRSNTEMDVSARARRETTDIARTLITSLKGSEPVSSHFSGCTDDGREAPVEARRFRNDVDDAGRCVTSHAMGAQADVHPIPSAGARRSRAPD